MKGETNSSRELIHITTPSRLHFSLIDLNGQLGRIDGGFGLAINEPRFEILAEPADDILVESINYRERATSILKNLQTTYRFPGLKLRFDSEIPTHCGFGSGTQLSLGIASAVNVLYDLNLSVTELAIAVGRGGTSGIGIAAFERGGFIVDGGHKYPEEKSSFYHLLRRKTFRLPLFCCDTIFQMFLFSSSYRIVLVSMEKRNWSYFAPCVHNRHLLLRGCHICCYYRYYLR